MLVLQMSPQISRIARNFSFTAKVTQIIFSGFCKVFPNFTFRSHEALLKVFKKLSPGINIVVDNYDIVPKAIRQVK